MMPGGWLLVSLPTARRGDRHSNDGDRARLLAARSSRESSVRRSTGFGWRCSVTIRIASWERGGDPSAGGNWEAVGGARGGPSRPAGRLATG